MVNLFTIIDTSLMFIVVLVIMLVTSMWQVSLKRNKNKFLILATLGLILELTLTIIYNTFCYLKIDDYTISIILSFMIVVGTVSSIFIIFYLINVFGVKKIKKRILLLGLLPVILQGYLLIQNLYTGSSFKVVDTVVKTGKLFSFHVDLLIFHLFICCVITIFNRKKISKKEFRTIMITAVLLGLIFTIEVANRNITILWSNITYAIIVYYALIQEDLIEYDSLTKAISLEYFYTTLLKEIKTKKREYTFALLDVDDLRSINKVFGVEEGDLVLKKIVETLYRTIGINDKVIKIAGDKFAIILEDDDIEKANKKLTNFKNKIVKYNDRSNNKYNIEYTLSMGVYDLNEIYFIDIMRKLTKEIYEIKKYKTDHYLKTFTQEM